MDRSDVVRRAAQKVVRMGYVVCNHRVAQGSYLGASFDKSLRLKKQFLVVMLKKRSSRRYTSSVANDIIIAGTRHANSGSSSWGRSKKPVMKMI